MKGLVKINWQKNEEMTDNERQGRGNNYTARPQNLETNALFIMTEEEFIYIYWIQRFKSMLVNQFSSNITARIRKGKQCPWTKDTAPDLC